MKFVLAFLLLAGCSLSAQSVLDAHNCYPYDGSYADRIDRALSAGFPVSIEQDLAWWNGRVVLSHSAQPKGTEPDFETYFFKRVEPLIKAALAKNDRSHWPLIYLHFDFKDNRPELLQAVWKILGRYEPWLSTAIKPQDPNALAQSAPYTIGPIMALTEDNDAQEAVFYTALLPGQKLRVFGSAHSPATPKDLTLQQRIDLAVITPPERLLTDRPTAYRRWWNNSWYVVEHGGARGAGEWNAETAARLKSLVEYSHAQGFRIRFYTIDGFTAETNRGWDAGYNFGSLARALTRWEAARDAQVDFIATDQYEELGKVLHPPTFHPTAGTMLLGSGPIPEGAFPWLIQKADSGDVVVLRADSTNTALDFAGHVHSLQTLTADTAPLSRDSALVEKIRNASGIFIQGQDPAKFVTFWQYSPIATALDYVATKGAPMAASGRGAAILGGLFASEFPGDEAFRNPYDPRVKIEIGFLTVPYMGGVLIDSLGSLPSRLTRLQVSIARALADGLVSEARAIGIDDETGLTVDAQGKARVIGKGSVYFLRASLPPEVCKANTPLVFRSLQTTRLKTGSTFDLTVWQ